MKKAKIIFHEAYLKYTFGPNHPFWPQRGLVFLEKLKKYQILHEILKPPKAKEKDILLAHSPAYLQKLKLLAKEGGGVTVDTPVTPENLKAAFYMVGGSVLTLKEALKGERAMNLTGGMHHAGKETGSGFCLLNDHAVAIRKLQKEGKDLPAGRQVKKAMVFDLDVHAGQGTQEIFYQDPKVFTISLHQDPRTLYPGVGFENEIGEGPGRGFNLNVPLPPGTREKEYLSALDEVLPFAKKFTHDLIVLVLGVDTYKEDPLANFELEIETYRKIGERFAKFPKVAVVCAGGYSKKTPDCWLSFLKGFLSQEK